MILLDDIRDLPSMLVKCKLEAEKEVGESGISLMDDDHYIQIMSDVFGGMSHFHYKFLHDLVQ